MRTFFYFLPDRNVLTPADAAAVGLAYAFESGIDCAQVSGLGGQRGIVCAQQDSYRDGQLGYHADQQTWRQIPLSSAWVGYYKNEPPGPEDLQRREQLGGQFVRCDDGRDWRIPHARLYSERAAGDEMQIVWTMQLPQRLDLAADGKWTAGGVIQRYAALWELNEAWLRVRDGMATEEDRARLDYQGQIDGAVLCLQANYRLGRAEAALLGLFNDELTVRLLDVLTDVEMLQALCKKKQTRERQRQASTPPAGSALSAGPAASTRTTDPPAPTSPPSPPASPTPSPSMSTS